jgi:crooked neck
MPETLWKAYIDFEVAEGERECGRDLYERLILLSGHVPGIAYALFEGEPIPIPRDESEEEEDEDDEVETLNPGDRMKARAIFPKRSQGQEPN